MKHTGFRKRLNDEFSLRRRKNPRYSLRAFALLIGTDHSTLSQILKGSRQAPVSQLMDWCHRIGIDEEEAAAYLIAACAPEPDAFARARQLRHWAAEAMAIVEDRTHWETILLCASPDFRSDSRWIAEELGVTADQVNVVLSRLLRLGLLEMSADGKWRSRGEFPIQAEKDFRRIALQQVRAKS
jgi:transcriptional regulator with XRE-family HTH domain